MVSCRASPRIGQPVGARVAAPGNGDQRIGNDGGNVRARGWLNGIAKGVGNAHGCAIGLLGGGLQRFGPVTDLGGDAPCRSLRRRRQRDTAEVTAGGARCGKRRPVAVRRAGHAVAHHENRQRSVRSRGQCHCILIGRVNDAFVAHPADPCGGLLGPVIER